MTPTDLPAMDADDRQPEVVVTLSDDVPEAQREAIRSSVREMARRSAAATLRAVDDNREHTAMLKRLSAPVKALVEADDDAAAALALEGAEVDRVDPDTAHQLPEWPPVTLVTDESMGDTDAFAPHQFFGAPWHFQWQWHTGRPPTRSTQDRPNGRIAISVHADQNNTWSDSHGGFGVALTSDRVQSVAARSLRRTNYWYYTHGGSFGGNATVEGGMEMTAVEGGRVLSVARDKRFRRRVSAGEREQYQQDGWETGESIQVDWVMVPGRVYTLNVGAWAFGEAHGGVGTASIGSAAIDALVIGLSADFTD